MQVRLLSGKTCKYMNRFKEVHNFSLNIMNMCSCLVCRYVSTFCLLAWNMKRQCQTSIHCGTVVYLTAVLSGNDDIVLKINDIV